MLILELLEVVGVVVSRDMVEVDTRVVLIRVDTCRLKTLEAVILLTVVLGMVLLVMVMEATVWVMEGLEGMEIHLVRLMGTLVSLELGLEVVQEVLGEVKRRLVTVTWDMEMLLLLRGAVLVVLVQQ